MLRGPPRISLSSPVSAFPRDWMLLRRSDWQVHMSWINRIREACSRLLNMLGLVDNQMELERCRRKDSERSLGLRGRRTARPGLHAYPGLLFNAGLPSFASAPSCSEILCFNK